jgi:hypothetical protein
VIRPGLLGLLRVVGGLALAIGLIVVSGAGVVTWTVIIATGIQAVWRDATQGPGRMNDWLVLLCTVGAVCMVGLPIWSIAKRLERQERYDELYPAAVRLKEAGQTLQDATARGSRGQVISAELHWLDAMADVQALRPPPSKS